MPDLDQIKQAEQEWGGLARAACDMPGTLCTGSFGNLGDGGVTANRRRRYSKSATAFQ
jgi:hypothetical protein